MELLDSMLVDARKLYEEVTGQPYSRSAATDVTMPMAKGVDPIAYLYQQLAHLKNLGAARNPAGAAAASWMPALDAYEVGSRVVLRVELPGVARTDVTLTVGDALVVVKGQRTFKAAEDQVVTMLAQERFFGPFERWIPLTFRINAREVRAQFRDGVLEIRLTKGEGTAPVGEPVEIQQS